MEIIGYVSLYPMFDNEAGLGFDRDESEYMSDKEKSNYKILKKCKTLKMKHIVPNDCDNMYSNIQDIVEFLFKKYPYQSMNAYKKVNSFSCTDFYQYLQQFTELSKTRKEMAMKFFVAHDIVFNKSAQKIINEKNIEKFSYIV